MQFEVLENGNLSITKAPEDTDMLDNILTKHGGDDLSCMSELLEETGWSPNGRLYSVEPEWIGALTDAPILTNDRTIEDDGTGTVHGKVWWFPNYMVENFMETLQRTGTVCFQAAPES